jgi:hypothetical protein
LIHDPIVAAGRVEHAFAVRREPGGIHQIGNQGARVMMQLRHSTSDTTIDQAKEILSYEISDEALEGAARTKQAANYTLFYCTALDLCPGP